MHASRKAGLELAPDGLESHSGKASLAKHYQKT